MMESFFLRRVAPWLGAWLIRLLGLTLRFRALDKQRLREAPALYKNVIYAFWHNRLILMPHLYKTAYGDDKLAVMVSQSKDGQIIADIIERFGFLPVRGSTTRGGKAALREMIRVLKAGWRGGFTPDGPRGPRYEAGPGVVVLAHLTGLPIVPVCWDVSKKIVFSSWDKMILPLPLARAVFRYGEPIEVSKDASPNVLQEKVLEVKKALNRLSDLCELELTSKADCLSQVLPLK